MSTLSSVVSIVEGAAMMPLNALLALTIFCDKNLRRRKELVLIVALALSNVLFGLGTLLVGCFQMYSSSMLTTGGNTTIPMVSYWSCFFTVRVVSTLYGGEVSYLLMMAISLERLMAVAWFQKYANIGIRKLVTWAVAAFTVPLVPLSYASYQVYVASDQGAMVSAACNVGVPPLWYAIYHNWFSGTVGTVSVVLYGGVLLAYRKVQANLASSSSGINNKLQNRLTITLGIISFFTLIFHSIPFATVTVLSFLRSYPQLATYVVLLVRINSMIYVFVIYWRQVEIRKSIIRLIFGSQTKDLVVSLNPGAPSNITKPN